MLMSVWMHGYFILPHDGIDVAGEKDTCHLFLMCNFVSLVDFFCTCCNHWLALSGALLTH
jgi:hypothetical protein